MRWEAFAAEAPALAGRIAQEFAVAGVVLVGTIRQDGSPRLSPVEPVLLSGDLYLDMMWQSQKARDLLRDPRCEVHAMPADRLAPQLKIWGNVEETQDPTMLERFAAHAREHLGWSPYPQHHLFRMDLEGATWISYDDPNGWMHVRTWRPGDYRERGPYPPAGSSDA
jgi:hypothetical protein